MSRTFVCLQCNDDSPECLTREKKLGAEAYLVGWGPHESTPDSHSRKIMTDFRNKDALPDYWMAREISVPRSSKDYVRPPA